MKDNEIIKALECCVNGEDCLNCPLQKQFADCKPMIGSLDLINRQQAEIKKCENIIRLADKTIEKQSAEIKRLEQENFDRSLTVETWKWEAVKEFAERFESKLNCIPQHHFTLAQVLYDLDKTKKEMVGEG